ncbi:hypothetical protein PAESOLCIP111_06075 [Paenibacillus solanacearum]|uniref:Uncharacterized protein n=1 Tax=Paenibacillus solanacearum TaxID=2048548 RepID=A0A916NLT6_9BACL|nr:hypothetical protein [Paenibacillus solanacearum]CAG7650421.1 hypothetical protein PAESOLCIP111_06075 [Paenibacillus solanacearum]
MSTSLQPASAPAAVRSAKPKKSNARAYVLMFFIWAVLIGLGLWGGKLYTDHIRMQITQDIAKQTGDQLAVIQQEYERQVSELRTSLTADMAQMQAKIDSVNELLAFTKDSANSKTDNSNQLYTQLAEVKKKLDELKKNLDALQ